MSTDKKPTDPRYAALSKEVRDFLEWNAENSLPPDADIAAIRARHRMETDHIQIDTVPVAHVRDVEVEGTHAPAALRIYQPQAEVRKDGPAILFFHGGSWMMGSVQSHDSLCRQMCHMTGLPVLSAEYGLAPENPFPKQTEDCITIYDWVCENRNGLGVDLSDIILCGDSSGANLVAVLTHDLKARNLPMPLAQILIYPSVALSKHRQYQSWKDYSTGFLIGEPSLVRTIKYYLNSEEDLVDPRVSPLLYEDFTGLPPALVLTAEYDPIRDGGRDYVARLVDAGVRTRFLEYPGTTHGFLSYGVPKAEAFEALSAIAEFTTEITREAAKQAAQR